VVNATTNTVTATIPLGINQLQPNALAIDPATNTIYVADYSGIVTVIDGATNTVVATVPVGLYPVAVAVNPATHLVYVASFGSASISVIK
jgi:YVTN family beta-propeller protein